MRCFLFFQYLSSWGPPPPPRPWDCSASPARRATASQRCAVPLEWVVMEHPDDEGEARLRDLRLRLCGLIQVLATRRALFEDLCSRLQVGSRDTRVESARRLAA